MHTQSNEETKRYNHMTLHSDHCKIMAIEIEPTEGSCYRVKWKLPNGEWNRIAFATGSLLAANLLTTELRAGLRDLLSGDLLDEGLVSNGDPCPVTNVL